MMKNILTPLFITILCVVFCTEVKAQKNFLKDAEKAFSQKEYFKATELYKSAYPKAPKNKKAYILFKTAECYRSINDQRQAEVYYGKCIKAHYDQVDADAQKYFADAKKVQGKYADAIIEYTKYKRLVPSDRSGEDGIQSCVLAQKWIADPTHFIVDNMVQINTKEWDYAPSYADKKYNTLIFSSTRNGITGDKIDIGAGQLYADLFTTHLDNKGKWSTAIPLPTPVNSEVNEAADVIAKKSNVMYFTRCSVEKNIDLKCQLYISVKQGTVWGTPSILPFCVDSFNFGHPAINAEENVLVFSSDMAGGAGGLDLWFAVYDKKNKSWSDPKNLGPEINTLGDEAFPFIHDDGTLYFASTGHLGMGGYDIFRAKKISGQDPISIKWNDVENMKYPINSSGDDFGLIFEAKRQKGYFTSDRIGGKGGDDIYSFQLEPVNICVEGYAKEKVTGNMIRNATIKLLGSDNTSTEVKTDSTGYYRYMLSEETNYFISGNGIDIRSNEAPNGYLGTPKNTLTTMGIHKSTCFKQDFELTKIEVEIPMPLVLYRTSHWELDHTSNPKDSLEFLYKVLVENPNITIELASHTDYRMGIPYNDTLSYKRAKSCVDYLISKGIAPDRMTARGYGERKPSVLSRDHTIPSGKIIPKGTVLTEEFINKYKGKKEDWEYLLQVNRRTVFSVLKKDYVPHDKSGNESEFRIDIEDKEDPDQQ